MRYWPERHLAFKCPECGRIELSILTIFAFSGTRQGIIRCGCGKEKLSIKTRDHRMYLVQVPCLVCESSHTVSVSAKRLWNDSFITVECPETGVELGYLGIPERIEKTLDLQRQIGEMLPEDACIEDFFNNPEIMYRILTRLHEIAKAGNLYCECGNDNVEIDLYSDKLELRCSSCNSLNIVFAENEEDLAVLQHIDTIVMKRSGFTSVDASRFNNKQGR